jgi:hypothetical protein
MDARDLDDDMQDPEPAAKDDQDPAVHARDITDDWRAQWRAHWMRLRPEMFDPNPRAGPEKEAARIASAFAKDGRHLVLMPDTPIIPDGHENTLAGTWGDLDALVRHWAQIGCEWVNLSFSIEPDGRALVRYDANPSDAPLEPGGRWPIFMGGRPAS